MGRDNVIPRAFFGVIEPKRNIPRNNILFIGALVLIGAFTLNYQLGAELLNFGAFIAFMGVNLAAFLHYWVRAAERKWTSFLAPLGRFYHLLLYLAQSAHTRQGGGLRLAGGRSFIRSPTQPAASARPPISNFHRSNP